MLRSDVEKEYLKGTENEFIRVVPSRKGRGKTFIWFLSPERKSRGCLNAVSGLGDSSDTEFRPDTLWVPWRDEYDCQSFCVSKEDRHKRYKMIAIWGAQATLTVRRTKNSQQKRECVCASREVYTYQQCTYCHYTVSFPVSRPLWFSTSLVPGVVEGAAISFDGTKSSGILRYGNGLSSSGGVVPFLTNPTHSPSGRSKSCLPDMRGPGTDINETQ